MEEKKERIFYHIVILFEYFSNKLSGKSKTFNPTERDKSSINKFIKTLIKNDLIYSVGSNYLYKMFLYHFNRWYEINTDMIGSKKVALSWIIGPKAFENWMSRDIDFDDLIERSDFVSNCRVDKSDILYSKLNAEKNVYVNYIGQVDRQKYYNHPDFGLAYCVQHTDLYNGSSLCRRCIHKKECIGILEDKYPLLFKRRKLSNVRKKG